MKTIRIRIRFSKIKTEAFTLKDRINALVQGFFTGIWTTNTTRIWLVRLNRLREQVTQTFSDKVMSLNCDTGGNTCFHVCGATFCYKTILPGITTSSSFGVNLGTAVVECASYFLLEDHFVKFLYMVRTLKHWAEKTGRNLQPISWQEVCFQCSTQVVCKPKRNI